MCGSLRSALIALLLFFWSGLAFSQSLGREARISEILVLARGGQLHLVAEALPMALRYAVREELINAERSQQAGREWPPRDPWFERAAKIADRASAQLVERVQAQPLDWEQAFRTALDGLNEAQLAGLLQLYRSSAAPVLSQLADLAISLFVLAGLETHWTSLELRAAVLPMMTALSDRIVALAANLQAEQRDALAAYAPGQSLKTLALVHEKFFHNAMRELQPAVNESREQVRRDLAPLLEQTSPLPLPADR